MLKGLLRRVREFVRCWQLARRIQRGALLAISPERLQAMTVILPPARLRAEAPPAPLVPPPEAAPVADVVSVEDEQCATGRYELILLTPSGRTKCLVRTDDAAKAKRRFFGWPVRDGYTLTYYDHHLGVSRGAR